MPWKVHGAYLVNQDTGRRMNKKPMSQARLLRYQRALYANVPEARRAPRHRSHAARRGYADTLHPRDKNGRWRHKELYATLKAYNPNQKRIPKGQPHAGQWTSSLAGGGRVLRALRFGRPNINDYGELYDPLGTNVPPYEPWNKVAQAARRGAQEGARAIDSVLTFPRGVLKSLNKRGLVAVLHGREMNPWGQYVAERNRMTLRERMPNHVETFVHEFGHLVDDQLLSRGAEEMEGGVGLDQRLPGTEALHTDALKVWWRAVHESSAFHQLARQSSMDKFKILSPKTGRLIDNNPFYAHYLSRRNELFARTFVQYIALKSKAPALLRAINKSLKQVTYPVYWRWSDFNGIAHALDRIMAENKLLPPGLKEFQNRLRSTQGRWLKRLRKGRPLRIKGYNPGQKRDKRGRWVKAGVAGIGAVGSLAAIHQWREKVRRQHIRRDWEWLQQDHNYAHTPESAAYLEQMRKRGTTGTVIRPNSPDVYPWIKDLRPMRPGEKFGKGPKVYRKPTLERGTEWLPTIPRRVKVNFNKGSRKYARKVEGRRWAKQAEHTLWGVATRGRYGGVWGGYLPPAPKLLPPGFKAYNPNQKRDRYGRWARLLGGLGLGQPSQRYHVASRLHAFPAKTYHGLLRRLPPPLRMGVRLTKWAIGRKLNPPTLLDTIEGGVDELYLRKKRRLAQRKEYNPRQRRYPKGTPRGGEWMPYGGRGPGLAERLQRVFNPTARAIHRVTQDYPQVIPITAHRRLLVNGRDVGGAYTGSRIYISSHYNRPYMNTAHEIGHALDHTGLGTLWASENSRELNGVRNAINRSQKVKELRAWNAMGAVFYQGRRIPISPQTTHHLLQNKELFARAFEQHYAKHSRHRAARKELRLAQAHPLSYYWNDKDFARIDHELGRVLNRHGYR